jgi:hypothetical protein
MRTIPSAFLAGLALVLATGVASADVDVAGTYDVKFEEVSTNCTLNKLAYAPQPVTVKVRGKSLIVDIDRTPEMVGVRHKNGKISAKSRLKNTMIDGMKGVFSVAGRVSANGSLQLVMVGEYSANGKALCTQSWNLSGKRRSGKAKAKSAGESTGTSAGTTVDSGEHDSVVDYFEHLTRIVR